MNEAHSKSAPSSAQTARKKATKRCHKAAQKLFAAFWAHLAQRASCWSWQISSKTVLSGLDEQGSSGSRSISVAPWLLFSAQIGAFYVTLFLCSKKCS
jgi:hypothetical protein